MCELALSDCFLHSLTENYKKLISSNLSEFTITQGMHRFHNSGNNILKFISLEERW